MRFNYLKPLARLFRAPPAAPPAARDSLAALDAGSPEFLMAATAVGNADELRAAAIARLPDGDALRRLAGLRGDSSDPSLERQAQKRLAELIDQGSVDFGDLRGSGTLGALLSVAGFSRDAALLPRALATIDDPGAIAALVTEGSSSRLRQLAAQSIEDPAELKLLLKKLRGKDKGVYRIIKQKCDALQAEERRSAQLDADRRSLCSDLERHGQCEPDDYYRTTLDRLESRWRLIEAQAPPELQERASAAIARCREALAEHGRQIERRAAEESRLAALRLAEREAAERARQEDERQTELAELAAAQAAALRAAEEQARIDKIAADALLARQIGGLIGKAHAALHAGGTARAAGLRRAIAEKLSTLPVAPPHITREIHKLDATLDEYKEWKEHAAAPKRAELIEDMEALIGSAEEPRALAERIKQLQEEWKTVSKGIVGDSEADWQRFHQASVTAYQPCREYFEAQAQLRQANLARRIVVLERLRAFESAQGDAPDWRAMARVLREAPREWREHFPVDRTANLAIQADFDDVIDRLTTRFDAWQADNASKKQTLIGQTQRLGAAEDGRDAVDAVKRLQQQWKEVGPAPHAQEQALWHEFRAHCDAVFQKRQQARADQAAALDANKAQAQALCEDAEQVATLTATDLRDGVQKLPAWRTAFDALGEMPAADQRALRARFERALDRCQARLREQQALERERSFADLFEAAALIQRYGWARAQNDDAQREALRQRAEAFIESVHLWPKGGAQAIKDAWTTVSAGIDPAALEAHDKALRLLCIRSEILAEHPTPPEDQGLRREYQIQRLVDRVNRHAGGDADDLDTLALEWLRVGLANAAAYDSLLARFRRCRTAA